MTERQTVAVYDSDGQLRWFPVTDVDRWMATTIEGGELYYVAGRWILLPGMADVSGQPAQIITDDEALDWLVSNGYSPPQDLDKPAARRRLGH